MLIKIDPIIEATTYDSIPIYTVFMDRWKLWGNVIILGVENSFSVHINGKNKTILVLGEELTKGLNNAAITAEAK